MALAFLLFSTPALAGSPCTDPPIPQRYEHETATPATMVEVGPGGLIVHCRNRATGTDARFACADTRINAIYILARRYLVAVGLSSVDIACLVKHEKAHLNGWPADHPF